MRVLVRMVTNFGRELAFSADLCYNKASSERKMARRSRDGRSLRDFRFELKQEINHRSLRWNNIAKD